MNDITGSSNWKSRNAVAFMLVAQAVSCPDTLPLYQLSCVIVKYYFFYLTTVNWIKLNSNLLTDSLLVGEDLAQERLGVEKLEAQEWNVKENPASYLDINQFLQRS